RVAAVVATGVAAGDELGWPWERGEGYGFLVLGLAWLELGRRGLVGPRRTSEALGSLVLLSGPGVLGAGGGGPGGGGGGLGAVARAWPGGRADRGRERAAPERAPRDRGRGHGGVPGPARRPALARPRRPPGHPAGRAGPGRGRGGAGAPAARRERGAALTGAGPARRGGPRAARPPGPRPGRAGPGRGRGGAGARAARRERDAALTGAGPARGAVSRAAPRAA